MPALLEAAFDQLAALAQPASLRPILQLMQQPLSGLELRRIVDPYFGQALVGRQLTSGRAEVLALHGGTDTVFAQRVRPKGRNREVGCLREAAHGQAEGAASGHTCAASRARSAYLLKRHAVSSIVMRRQVSRLAAGVIAGQCCTSPKVRPQPLHSSSP